MNINRCVCVDRTFAELLELADSQGLAFDQLADQTGCSRGCGLCEPYVRCTLETRRTVFSAADPIPVTPQNETTPQGH